MIDLYTIIEKSATAAINLQRSNGAMPRGHNGPYLEPETPVRNTSHWLITFAKAYQTSGDKKYYDAVRRATRYLLSEEARPMGKTFRHRKDPEQDASNGLIGQAWTIEALVTAARLLEDDEPLQIAKQVFLLHPFQRDLGLWQITDVDGTYLEIDYTLNHQIWFAASGALLARHSDGNIQNCLDIFLDKLCDNFQTHRSGLVKHRLSSAYTWLRTAKQVLISIYNLKIGYSKLFEIGYHPFNLYGLSILYKNYKNHRFWKNESFIEACRYIKSNDFVEGIWRSGYGFPYNSPGFEVAFVLETFTDIFGEDTDEARANWVRQQIDRCYDPTSHFMERNCHDSATHAARLYEATRLKNQDIGINT